MKDERSCHLAPRRLMRALPKTSKRAGLARTNGSARFGAQTGRDHLQVVRGQLGASTRATFFAELATVAGELVTAHGGASSWRPTVRGPKRTPMVVLQGPASAHADSRRGQALLLALLLRLASAQVEDRIGASALDALHLLAELGVDVDPPIVPSLPL